jgi:hypothetical protein
VGDLGQCVVLERLLNLDRFTGFDEFIHIGGHGEHKDIGLRPCQHCSLPQFDVPQFDVPQFDVPQFDVRADSVAIV